MKTALITGIFGQQASYLAEFLLGEDYEVYGLIRPSERTRVDYKPLLDLLENDRVSIFKTEMTDYSSLRSIINRCKPDEIYNLAAMNDVALSYDAPDMTIDVNCGGLARIIVICRTDNINCKIYQACSSEMFGIPIESPQNESTTFYPRSPYGVSKCAAYHLAKTYREQQGMKIYCGIIYNNESPRRPEVFLSKKVCKYVASVYNGNKEKLKLGNLEARRDFGYAKEYVEWTWRIMQHETPDDFILATGVTHSVAEFVETAFKYVGIDNWRDYIEVDQSLYRPSEEKLLVGDASKSIKLLGFAPKTTFKELISIMMEHELKQYDK